MANQFQITLGIIGIILFLIIFIRLYKRKLDTNLQKGLNIANVAFILAIAGALIAVWINVQVGCLIGIVAFVVFLWATFIHFNLLRDNQI